MKANKCGVSDNNGPENGVVSVLTSVDKVLKDLAEDEPVKPVLAN